MLDFIRKYSLKIEASKEKLFIYNGDGDYILSVILEDKSIEFDYNDRLKFNFVKDLIEVLEKQI